MNKSFSRVLIKDSEGNILVVQDRDNLWNFPSGKREADETLLQCAKREVKEEIGVQVNKLYEIHQGTYWFSGIKWTGHFFIANSVSGIPSLNEMDKIMGIRFIKDYEEVEFPEELLESVKYIFEESNFKFESTHWF
ncbi:NUDIX hydrolase [Pseudalkalibacillus berkeleyi]|uniref:NUDIX hydrolase n=1 Tax=Pseudalkalibacillus berkeleyi TaxID=1069813 RepID=A0ABS9GYD1_9BACL|nr:NUDIX hydrolase [Pseudalkalibacillus berkeleyi]MCF6137758.1 NUDIX hydrolase [Pseudalkalibacillus berkeleyi]